MTSCKDNKRKRVYDKTWRETHKEQDRANHQAWRKANPEKVKAQNKERCPRDPEKVSAYNRAYREAHPEKGKVSQKAYREAHPEYSEREKADRKAYREAHPEKEKSSRKARYEAHREEAPARQKAWRKAHPEKERAIRARRRVRELRKTQVLLGIWMCSYCARQGTEQAGPDGKPWHIEHIVALSNDGEHDPDNRVLSCERCNLNKLAHPAMEWLATRNFKLPLAEMLASACWSPGSGEDS